MISKRSVKELLQDIKIALGCMNDNVETKKLEVDPLCITWRCPVESGSMTKDEIKKLRDKLEKAEEKIETEKIMKEDLDTKLNITRANLNETQKKLSSLEVEFDYRKSCCEKLEGTCIKLQLQLESVEMKKLMQRNKNGCDITSASIKLLECQETITNLRKQLSVLSTTETIQDSKTKDSSYKAEDDQNSTHVVGDGNNCNALIVYKPVNTKGEKMKMVPRKKQGLGFLKKLLFRRKKVGSKKCIVLTM